MRNRNRPARPGNLEPDRQRDRRPGRQEPAMVRGLIVAVLGVLAALGVDWATDVDKGTIATLTTVALAVLPLLQAAWTRLAVTPSATVLAKVDPDGVPVAGDAATVTTGRRLPTVGETVAVVPATPVV